MASMKTISSGHTRDLVSCGTLKTTIKMDKEANHECIR
jgi:hypothetical protein